MSSDFNSTVVQLEGMIMLWMIPEQINFNSTVVQLEDFAGARPKPLAVFQFYCSPIRSRMN